MARKYTFTTKDLEIIREARKKNKDKRADGKQAKEIAEAVGISAPYVS